MADGVAVTAGAGTTIATDDLTGDGTVGGHVQLVKLLDGTDGGNTRVPATANKGLAVEPRAKVSRIAVAPVVSAAAIYAAKDAIGARLDFANASRVAGGTGLVLSAVLADRAQQRAAIDLVLFRSAITAPTDNAVFDPTDAELLDAVGFVSFLPGDYVDFNDNSFAYRGNLALPFDTGAGTTLYGALVARGTPTYAATTDVQVALSILQD